MKVWRVFRDLSLGFLTFILDDTGVWVEEFREKIFGNIQKNNKPHIFTPPRPLGSGGVKIWGLLFFGYSQKFLSELVSLYSVQTPVSSKTDLLKPFRSSFSPYQMIHSVEIERGRASRYQITILVAQFHRLSVITTIFYAGDRYKLLNQPQINFSCSDPSWVSM